MSADELKVVTDYVLQIREQGNHLYETLLTISMGTILAGVLVAAFAIKGDNRANYSFKRICFIAGLALTSLVFFLVYIGFLRVKYTAKRDFCDKWIANHLQSTSKDAAILISEFSASYYGFVHSGEAKYIVNPNDRPNNWGIEYTEGKVGCLTTYFLPCLSGVLVVICLLVLNRSSS